MRAQRFFYVAAGLACLALAYHWGASTARAQVSGNTIVAAADEPGGFLYVFTANGDAFYKYRETWLPAGNVFGGGPVPVTHTSFGQVKARWK